MARAVTTFRELFALAWPIAAAMLGDVGMGLVDTKLVGGLGAAALGGVGIATVLMYLSYSIVFGLMRGVKVRTAYALGHGRPGDAVRYAEAGLAVGAIVGLVVFALCRDVTPALRLMRVDPETMPYAREFLAARTMGAVSACGLSALVQYRQGLGDARSPMVIGIAGNVVNAVLAWALIHGRLGLPALGVRGAGYATAFSETLEFVALAALLARDVARANRAAASPRLPLRRALAEVVDLGLPMGLHFGLETLGFTTFNAVIASLGAAEMAASHVAMNTLRASFLPGIAVGEAASVLVARALARRRIAEADRVTRLALLMSMTFMGCWGVVFALSGGALAAQFSTDPVVVHVARRLFLVAAVFQVLDAANMVLRCALRGAKDVRWVAMVGTTIVWCTIPTSAFGLGEVLHLGALGGWIGFVGETTFGA
ncbi:MAG TPA: MATE family efflux transporter, partial [Minicystis sp.]|nr:MATE family efflux transporter [Minicystis sp.]